MIKYFCMEASLAKEKLNGFEVNWSEKGKTQIISGNTAIAVGVVGFLIGIFSLSLQNFYFGIISFVSSIVIIKIGFEQSSTHNFHLNENGLFVDGKIALAIEKFFVFNIKDGELILFLENKSLDPTITIPINEKKVEMIEEFFRKIDLEPEADLEKSFIDELVNIF